MSHGAVAVFGLPDNFRCWARARSARSRSRCCASWPWRLAGHIVLTRTRLGRYSYAIGSNPEAARLSGIGVARYLVAVYTICGALAGFGGMIAASRVNSGQPNFGIGLELDVIAAA